MKTNDNLFCTPIFQSRLRVFLRINFSCPARVILFSQVSNLTAMLALHPILESSERCKNAINSVPFVAFRKPESLGDYLVRAKVDSRGHRDSILGTVKCLSRRCEVCKPIRYSSLAYKALLSCPN